jgi:hypothetical protein
MIAGGARPVDLGHMRTLADLARTAPFPPRVRATEEARRRKILARPVTIIPSEFAGTPQGDLIAKLDAMTRDPDLPLSEYGKSHAALRKALKGLTVDS